MLAEPAGLKGPTEWGRQVRNERAGHSIRSVIESDQNYPECEHYREQIFQEFSQSGFTTKQYKDVTTEQLAAGGDHGEVHLELKPVAQAKSGKAVRAIGLREKILREKIQEFENRGYLIEVDPDQTKWVSQAFLVPKPSGKWRRVIDYRWLNSQLKGQNLPLPVIEDQLAKQQGNGIWTLVDLEDGFHQMWLAPSSQPLTAFIAPFGVFQWTVLPMGVKVGRQVFQRMVAHVLRGCRPASSPYMDDVLTGTGKPPPAPSSGKGQVRDSHAYKEASQQTPELLDMRDDPDERKACMEHQFQEACKVFLTLAKAGLTVEPAKCHLLTKQVKYIGLILSKGCRYPDPQKLDALASWKADDIKTPKALKGFLGLANWYSIYIKDYATHEPGGHIVPLAGVVHGGGGRVPRQMAKRDVRHGAGSICEVAGPRRKHPSNADRQGELLPCDKPGDPEAQVLGRRVLRLFAGVAGVALQACAVQVLPPPGQSGPRR